MRPGTKIKLKRYAPAKFGGTAGEVLLDYLVALRFFEKMSVNFD
jgi:hypothetical protein